MVILTYLENGNIQVSNGAGLDLEITKPDLGDESWRISFVGLEVATCNSEGRAKDIASVVCLQCPSGNIETMRQLALSHTNRMFF